MTFENNPFTPMTKGGSRVYDLAYPSPPMENINNNPFGCFFGIRKRTDGLFEAYPDSNSLLSLDSIENYK